MARKREVEYKITDRGCWEVTSHKASSNGYPAMSSGKGRTPIRLHRWAWAKENGDIPDGLCVCHHCDNPVCINPSHLFLGTQADNMADRKAKNALKPKPAKPAKRPLRKLTDEQVDYILKHTEVNSTDMAKLLNVSLSNVSLIRNGKRRRVEGFDYEAIAPISIERRARPRRPRREIQLSRLERKIERLTAELAKARVQRSLLLDSI